MEFTRYSTSRFDLGEIVHPKDAHTLKENFSRLAERSDEPCKQLCRLRWRDGTWRWIELSLYDLTQDPAINAIMVSLSDVDDRVRIQAELLQRNRELELVSQATKNLVSTLQLNQVLALTLDGIRELLGVTACSVWLNDSPGEGLCCRQVTDPAASIIHGWRLLPGQGLAGWVEMRGESLNVPDAQADPRHYSGVDDKTGLKLCSILSVPLKTRGRVIGVLQAVDTAIGRFSDNDQRLIESLASVAAGAIDNARLYEELALSQKRARNIVDSSLDMIITVDVNRRIVEFNQAAQKAFGYRSDEVVGRHVEILYSDRLLAQEVHDTTFREGLCVRRVFNVRKDGTHFPALISASLLRDAQEGLLGVMGISRDITSSVQAEAKIQASLEEKEVLLREIHHRVKNNLQIISSILALQDRVTDDPNVSDILIDIQNRVRSMSLVHETLYRSPDLSCLNLRRYLQRLASHLYQMYSFPGREIDFSVDGDDILLDIDRAVPCGLIVNELLSNSLIHAFPSSFESTRTDRRRRVGVKLVQEVGQCHITVWDNGVGFPNELEWSGTETLGLRLVHALVGQLDAQIELDRTSGTAFAISF